MDALDFLIAGDSSLPNLGSCQLYDSYLVIHHPTRRSQASHVSVAYSYDSSGPTLHFHVSHVSRACRMIEFELLRNIEYRILAAEVRGEEKQRPETVSDRHIPSHLRQC